MDEGRKEERQKKRRKKIGTPIAQKHAVEKSRATLLLRRLRACSPGCFLKDRATVLLFPTLLCLGTFVPSA